MTDFTEGRTLRCPNCHKKFYSEEGKDCDCWRCQNCGEWFGDTSELANEELHLCTYCEDERLQMEVKNEAVRKEK